MPLKNPRTKYATDSQESTADRLIESVRPCVDKLNEKHPGTWGLVKTALAGLIYNDCDWIANSVAAALQGKGDPSVYIDSRVPLKAVDGRWFSRKTPAQITKAVDEIGKLMHGERRGNPRIAAGWSTHNLGGGKQWFKRLAAGSVNVQQIRKGAAYEARKIDSAGTQHHLGSAKTLAAAKALALGAKSNPKKAAKKNPSGLSNYAAYLRVRSKLGLGKYQSDVDYTKYKTNPAYKASFATDADKKTVRKTLKGQGYVDIRVRGGKPRAPGAYAQFVKEQMPIVRAKGFTVAAAMKEIGKLWRAKKPKSNPKTKKRNTK